MKSIKIKIFTNYIVFLLNLSITIFAALFAQWVVPFGGVGHISFILLFLISNIFFMFFPKIGRSYLLNIIIKVSLHALTTYLLVTIFGYMFRILYRLFGYV